MISEFESIEEPSANIILLRDTVPEVAPENRTGV